LKKIMPSGQLSAGGHAFFMQSNREDGNDPCGLAQYRFPIACRGNHTSSFVTAAGFSAGEIRRNKGAKSSWISLGAADSHTFDELLFQRGDSLHA